MLVSGKKHFLGPVVAKDVTTLSGLVNSVNLEDVVVPSKNDTLSALTFEHLTATESFNVRYVLLFNYNVKKALLILGRRRCSSNRESDK